MTYTTSERIAEYLNRELTANELASIDSIISSISAGLSAYLGRSYLDIDADIQDYVEEVETSTRLYDGYGERELFIDDFFSISTLKLLDSFANVTETIQSSDYISYPLNSPYKSSVYLRNRHFPHRMASVEVTGQFTSGLLPQEVINAATALVAAYFGSQSMVSLNTYVKESIEGYSYDRGTGTHQDTSEMIMNGISHLRKITF